MVAPPDNDVLWARALHVTHNGSPALTGVSLGVREGEILAVTGPRGSGKTTLLRCLSGQLLPDEGEVWFNSTPVHTMGPVIRERLRRDRFGWIDPEPHLVPELTGWENVAMPLMLRGASHRVSKTTAQEWLDRLDIGDCARKRPHALLQAQRQRIAIARALVTMPSVIFADEPTAPLHRADRAHVLRTLTTAARSHGITVVIATHDTEVAALADRTVTLLDGRRVNTVHLPGSEELAAATEGGPGAHEAAGGDAAEGAGDAGAEGAGAAGAGGSGAADAGGSGAADAGGSGIAATEGSGRAAAVGAGTAGAGGAGTAGGGDSGIAATEGSGRAAAVGAGTAGAGGAGTSGGGDSGIAATEGSGKATAVGSAGTASAGGSGSATAEGSGTATAGGSRTATTEGSGTAEAEGSRTAAAEGLGRAAAEGSGTAGAGGAGIAAAEGSGTPGGGGSRAVAAAGSRAAGAGDSGTAGVGGSGAVAVEGDSDDKEGRAACSLSV